MSTTHWLVVCCQESTRAQEMRPSPTRALTARVSQESVIKLVIGKIAILRRLRRFRRVPLSWPLARHSLRSVSPGCTITPDSRETHSMQSSLDKVPLRTFIRTCTLALKVQRPTTSSLRHFSRSSTRPGSSSSLNALRTIDKQRRTYPLKYQARIGIKIWSVHCVIYWTSLASITF